MSKNPSERKGMPGEKEDLNRDTQQGQRGQQGQQGQQGQHGQQQKHTDPNKQQRNPGGSDTEDTGDRSKRTA